ncbi:DUF4410 domain-containing protein [Paraburkholderia tagetis]|uniref:DUF4410 domain-containing protein n=1 Tax=Paraburkholderia tagetis TaxID=2913261 RepID=A0A9X1RMB1_9BURK|nr:DUF4410 domain-containing protein [Paraburkholderia tagetis]MCG5072492.1 DUF4410 domain-containing protein [Paraburkholderia tagetis]
MNTFLHSLVNKTRRFAGAALLAGSLLASGCASAASALQAAGPLPQVHADVIYVSAFDISPDLVKLDSGMAQKLKMMASGESSAQQQQQVALAAREKLADNIVAQLQKMGLPAMRVDGPVPAGRNAIVVEGRIDTVDAGSRRRRTLIGLGAGKSEVDATIAVSFLPANGAPQSLVTFETSANSGHMPGMAETAGVGAAAGHLAASAAVGGGLHGASEAKRGTISADAGKLANSIARQIAQAATQYGWVPVSKAG